MPAAQERLAFVLSQWTSSRYNLAMQIKAMEPIAVGLAMKKPVQMSGETVARADNVLVRIESGHGVVGWG